MAKLNDRCMLRQIKCVSKGDKYKENLVDIYGCYQILLKNVNKALCKLKNINQVIQVGEMKFFKTNIIENQRLIDSAEFEDHINLVDANCNCRENLMSD